MKPDIAKKWVEALRSGEYRQYQSALRGRDDNNRDRFCCLGVLCQLYPQETGDGVWIEVPEDRTNSWNPEFAFLQPLTNIPEAWGTLPPFVQEWAGIKDSCGDGLKRVGDNLHYTSLTEANDSGESFAKIADLIEANVENL